MILWMDFVGPYAAADVAERNRPEWPPHPDRLFQALVDAAQPEDRPALRWLEQQPAPGIVCGETVPLESAETFVPVNHPGASPDLDRRGKQPRSFPMSFPRGPVGFVWPEPDDACREALARLAARVANVGRAESLVLLRVEAGDAEPALVPDERGEQGLRVPHAGRLDVLDQAFGIGRYPPAAPMVRYAEAGRVVALPPWSELIAVRLTHPLSVERVALAAEALRRAVLSRVGDDAPAVLHGHGPHTHVAWVGLPNLSPYARGELLGLAMALPRSIDPMERAQCVRGLLAVDHIMLGERRVGVERPTQAMSLAARTWSHASTVWASVTPVVFDRFPRRNLSAEQVVMESFVRAGYPKPQRVAVVQASAHAMPRATAFRLRRPGKLYAHVVAEFGRPVRGPLIVGAERHFGLGLFLPARTSSDGAIPGGSRTGFARASA